MQETGDLGDMDPCQKVGIMRRIGRAVGKLAMNMVMDRLDPADQRKRLLPRAIGRAGDELRRAAQSARGGWIVVDEAFAETTPGYSIAAESTRRSVVVLRSFGKFFGQIGRASCRERVCQ